MTRVRARRGTWFVVAAVSLAFLGALTLAQSPSPAGHNLRIGDERAVPRHLKDGEEFKIPLSELIAFGRKLFTANWTDQDGAGRPLLKGTGLPLSDRTQRLTDSRAFNRISGPDANSCLGCHVGPSQLPGGGGDFVANAWVMADRFDFVTFATQDTQPTRGAVDERGRPVTLQTAGNSRLTPGLWGAGYLEMLARQMTNDLRRIRDGMHPGQSEGLFSSGVSFGALARRRDGSWDTSGVQGLPRRSTTIATAGGSPSLTIYPWRQSGSVVSLREMTNSSFHQHHGMQSTERFGAGTDPDGDHIVNELTRADVTAITVWQATLPVPGRVIPNDPEVEGMILKGQRLFDQIRCTTCHVASLPLELRNATYSEPGPFNRRGDLRRGPVPLLQVDLSSALLPSPRLAASAADPDVIQVPAYTDFKLHDITEPNDRDAAEALDINERPGSARFSAGNRHFLTRRLWDVGNQPAHFHHGLFPTLEQAVIAHAGEAREQRQAFERLDPTARVAVIAFLRSLQVLPPGTPSLVVDERFRPRSLTRDKH